MTFEALSGAPLLPDLFGPWARTAELWGDAGVTPLRPQEDALITTATGRRRTDFRRGRHCAREALAALGDPPRAILADARGAPLWPPGFTGSITHCEGFCAAVAAPNGAVLSVGVDAELLTGVDEALWDQVLTSTERSRLLRLPPADRVASATTIFSAKEAFYKAQYQVTGAWLDFQDVEVVLRGDLFSVEPQRRLSGVGSVVRGRSCQRDGLVVTAVELALPGR